MKRLNTRTLIWFGRNSANQSNLSSKVYMVAVRGRHVHTKWGAANLVSRRIEPLYLQSSEHRYPSHQDAVAAFDAILASKLSRGYERAPRGIAAGLSAV
jgi:predicted DNA-binding WGR domain protein